MSTVGLSLAEPYHIDGVIAATVTVYYNGVVQGSTRVVFLPPPPPTAAIRDVTTVADGFLVGQPPVITAIT